MIQSIMHEVPLGQQQSATLAHTTETQGRLLLIACKQAAAMKCVLLVCLCMYVCPGDVSS